MALASASTSLAALNYEGGNTAHSLFSIPVHDDQARDEPVVCTIPGTSQRADLLCAAKIIVWDEICSAKREDFESVDALLQSLCQNSYPFGGKVFIACGDARQIPCVVKGSANDASTIYNTSAMSSRLWRSMSKILLSTVMRVSNELAVHLYPHRNMTVEQEFVKHLNDAVGQNWDSVKAVYTWLASYENVAAAAQQKSKTLQQWFRWWSLHCHPDKLTVQFTPLANELFKYSQNMLEKHKKREQNKSKHNTHQSTDANYWAAFSMNGWLICFPEWRISGCCSFALINQRS